MRPLLACLGKVFQFFSEIELSIFLIPGFLPLVELSLQGLVQISFEISETLYS